MADLIRSGRCPVHQHALGRRSFFTAAAVGGATSLGWLTTRGVADELKRQQKRVLMIFLNGGASQFETWDPKTGRPTGGPFISIPTSVPGYRMCELMPQMAKRIHQHTAVIRSVETKNGDHQDAVLYGGRPKQGVVQHPSLGCMLASELADPHSALPHHVMFSNYLGQSYYTSAGFLGSKWNPVNIKPGRIEAKKPFTIDDSQLRLAPPDTVRPQLLTRKDHAARGALRDRLSRRFRHGRERSTTLASYDSAYGRVAGLMDSAKLFRLDDEPQRIRDRYGPTPFAQQTLVARRLIEAGVPFVRVNRGWWDFHGQNFEFHHEMVPELDHVLAALLDDLQERGLLEHTLVMTFSEMGRTPRVNDMQGRDHFPRMSVTLSGCGIKPGVIYGKTDADGNEIVEDEVLLQPFFATVFKALGIDHQKENTALDGRPVPLTVYDTDPIDALLA